MPALFKIGPDLTVVVQLAVHHDDDRSIAAKNRLVAGLEIDYRKPPHSEGSLLVDPQPFGIRTTMHDGFAHRVKHRFGVIVGLCCVQVEPTRDAAHLYSLDCGAN